MEQASGDARLKGSASGRAEFVPLDARGRRNALNLLTQGGWKDGLMLHGALVVYEGVLAKFRSVVRQTTLQRQRRFEKAFGDLSRGRMSHSTARAEWEHLLLEMEDSGIGPSSHTTLFRRYSSKIPPPA